MRKISLSTALGFFFFVSSVFATIIRVPQDQPTIQAGINAAVNGDTVLVAPGTYSEHLSINGKNLSIISTGGAEVTELVANSVGEPIVYFYGGVDSTAKIRGFTLRGTINAAAITCVGTNPIIENNIVRNNTGNDEQHHGITVLSPPSLSIIRNNKIQSSAGGIHVGEGRALITGNIIDGNNGINGGGIFLRSGNNSQIIRNLIINNSSNLGGGITVSTTSNCLVENNTIAGNTANTGSGLALWSSSSPIARNNIIVNNGPNYGLYSSSANPLVAYNDVWNNIPSNYGGISPGIGSISEDPLFIGGSPFDYSLRISSPCIDSGDPVTPVPSGGGLRVDIGAFETVTSLLLVTPNNFANLNVQRPQFVWTRLRDSSGIVSSTYQVLLATEMNFLTPDSSPMLTDTTWKVPSKLAFGQTYFWKVTAFSDSGDTVFSQVRSFNISLPFEAVLPMDGPLRRPTFLWRGINDTTIADSFRNFRVIVAKDCDPPNAETSSVLTDTMWKVPYKLDFEHIYCWKIFSISDSGDTATSDVHSFNVGFPIITKVYPGYQELIDLRQPTFVWQPLIDTSVTDTIKYRVYLNKNYVAEETSEVIIDTVWKIPHKLELNQNYFWTLLISYENEPWDTLGAGPHYFTTLLPTVSLYQPVNFSRIGDKRPNFLWEALSDTSIPDTFFYRLTYANNPSFTSASTSPLLTDDFWEVPGDLDIATTYYWKVLAFYSGANDTVFPYENSRFLLAPTTINVPLDRPTIQQAIDISINGDTVLVETGVYQQNIFFSGKRIKLFSEGGAENTTIQKLVDGAPLVSFNGSEDSNTVLRGFTLKGARLAPNGAAINVSSASPVIENNLIQDNQGDSAVIYVQGGSPKIRRNLIADNNTSLAAIGFFGGSGGQVINNTIANNTGDGIRITPTMAMQIKNNIFAFNTGYGIRSVGGINNSSTVSYNDLYSNTQGTYFATIPTTGDIFQNPQFRSGNPFDYHLLVSSPCIDAGDPAFPIPPGGGTRMDIGAFEFVPTLGDLNGDGLFTPADVVLELNCVFLATGNCPLAVADMNCDTQLTPTDVVLILNFVFLGSSPPCPFDNESKQR